GWWTGRERRKIIAGHLARRSVMPGRSVIPSGARYLAGPSSSHSAARSLVASLLGMTARALRGRRRRLERALQVTEVGIRQLRVHRIREVALPKVADDRDDQLSRALRPPGHLQRRPRDPAGRDAG